MAEEPASGDNGKAAGPRELHPIQVVAPFGSAHPVFIKDFSRRPIDVDESTDEEGAEVDPETTSARPRRRRRAEQP